MLANPPPARSDSASTGARPRGAVERGLGRPAKDGVIELRGVISRKKQVAPRLIAAV